MMTQPHAPSRFQPARLLLSAAVGLLTACTNGTPVLPAPAVSYTHLTLPTNREV